MKCEKCGAYEVGGYHVCIPLKNMVFRGQTFGVRVTEDFVYLYPPEGVTTREHLRTFTPNEEELSEALGYRVEFVDYTGLVNEYEIVRD